MILFFLMSLIMIAALSENKVIWREWKLPRDYPADLKRFKLLTQWSPIIMGRGTYESIGKALPWRDNIVVSSTKLFEDVTNCEHPDDALAHAEEVADEQGTDIYVIWGESLYKYFLDQAEFLYLTHINRVVEWDRFFPTFESEFEEIEREEFEEYDFVTRRKKR
jgi:dihydrofolate reductase